MNRQLYLAFSHGSWHAREQYPVYDENGEMKIRERWHALGIKGKNKRAAAEKALEAMKQRLARGQQPAGSEMPFTQFATMYLNLIRLSVRPKTIESYEMWIRSFETQFGGVPLQHITSAFVDRWKVRLATRYSPTIVNIALRTLRAAFSFARKHGMLTVSPLDPVASLDVPKHDFPPFWRREQFDRFIETVGIQRQRTAFSLAFFAGLRLGEVVSLRWEDVRSDHIVIESRAEHRTKSDRSRKVPLFSSLRAEIEQTPQRSDFVVAPTSVRAWLRSRTQSASVFVSTCGCSTQRLPPRFRRSRSTGSATLSRRTSRHASPSQCSASCSATATSKRR